MAKRMNYHHIPTAILVDGAFFLKRYRKCFAEGKTNYTPKEVADKMHEYLLKHLNDFDDLYRIFYYDSLPLDKRAHNPINKKSIDFSKTDIYKFRMNLFDELKKHRKVALRLGYVKSMGDWQIHTPQLKKLFNGSLKFEDLTEEDVYLNIKQKGVDIRIGLDIATLSYKKLVKRIILVSGDSDFVSAAKLARREGIDVILDPLWQHIDDSLFEHIDGLRSQIKNPYKPK